MGQEIHLPNLINHQPGIDNSYLYAKDPYGENDQLLIKKCQSASLKNFYDPKTFIEYLNYIDDIKDFDGCNPNKKSKTLMGFDDMIPDMLNKRKINPVVTDLLIKGGKVNNNIQFRGIKTLWTQKFIQEKLTKFIKIFNYTSLNAYFFVFK